MVGLRDQRLLSIVDGHHCQPTTRLGGFRKATCGSLRHPCTCVRIQKRVEKANTVFSTVVSWSRGGTGTCAVHFKLKQVRMLRYVKRDPSRQRCLGVTTSTGSWRIRHNRSTNAVLFIQRERGF